MMKYVLAVAIQLFSFVPAASAHYLFLSIDPSAGEHGTMNLFFEEGPQAGDGFYLDPFLQRGKAWLRVAGVEESRPLKLLEVKVEEKNQRWAASELAKSDNRAVESYCQWGVYRYGETDVLLHYYGKFVDVETAEQLAEVGQSDNLKLDVRPTWQDGSLSVQVMWDGKPLGGSTIFLRGPGLNKKVTADEDGNATIKPEKPGRFTLR
ncbi:MAG: hypothetical protein AB7O62_07545, partial [Pirellulales bacterium]